ncbi:MAG: serine O-acetyltransferase [Steroidobacteraceae bacterium]
MSSYWNVVRADVRRCVSDKQTSLRRIAIVGVHMGLQAVLVYRFGRLLRASRKRVAFWPLLPIGWLLYGLAAFWVRRAYGIHIALSADIGPGFWVGHFGGVEVINCRLGERCSVGQQTHVGHAQHADGPEIGDGAWIGAHARISGPVRVGNGVTIAPGARVTRNVPDRALVVGDPGRVVLTGYDNSRILPHP